MMSATESASHLREMMRMWDSSGDPRDPFAHVLVSPLFASRAALRLVRELKDKRQTSIIFDSGGFCVQQGRLTYDELCASAGGLHKEPMGGLVRVTRLASNITRQSRDGGKKGVGHHRRGERVLQQIA